MYTLNMEKKKKRKTKEYQRLEYSDNGKRSLI